MKDIHGGNDRIVGRELARGIVSVFDPVRFVRSGPCHTVKIRRKIVNL